MDTDEIKKQAIEETITFFNKKYNLTPDSQELLKFLNREDEKDYVEELLRYIIGRLEQGEKEELLIELRKDRNAFEKEKDRIHFDHGCYVSNSKPINVVNQFCLNTFYSLFFGYQIAQINNFKIQPAADTNDSPPKTIAEKIEKILKEPLRGAFDEIGHIDKIIEALAVYAVGTTPECVENESNYRKNNKIGSKNFYTPFKGLNKTISLTNKQIAEVLQCFIYAGNGSQNKLEISTIITNINRKYPKIV